MNLVGKILTVFIFVMSLVFMSFAIAVYATHVNWRDRVVNTEPTLEKPLGLQLQLEQAQKDNAKLKSDKEKFDAELSRTKDEARQAVAKLQTESDEQKKLIAASEGELQTLRKSQRQAVAAMESTQATLAAMRQEVDTLRKDIRTTQTDRDTRFQEVVALTDQLHEAVNEMKRLKERQLTLSADLARYREVLDKHGLQPEPSLYSGIPPKVEGLVLATREPGLVEISIGSDDGLQKGHRLEVYRKAGGTSTYLGRVEVVKTDVDRSVCKILPEFQKGTLQRGDRVASKLD